MILIVGATGSLGGRLTHTLLAQGRPVRTLVRSRALWEGLLDEEQSSAAWTLVEAGAKTVQGDLKNRVSIRAAVAGVDTVIAGATAVRRGGDDTIEAVDWQGTLDLIAEAAGAGVRRFIYISMLGAADDHPLRLLQIKAECERAVQQTGMVSLIVRPALFMETWIPMVVGLSLFSGEPVYLLGRGDHRHNFISETDAAKLIVAMIDDSAMYGRPVPLTGPASFSWTQIVQTISRQTGKPLAIQYQLPGLPVAHLPVEAAALINAFETTEDEPAWLSPADMYGLRLTTLPEYIERAFVAEAWPVTPGLCV
jgi:uncharacterized protein YbjT (DUF2867 family)